ncbi:hypothetical protein BKI52_33100 [marine bacterium AO1-C]|nr:hypothetical protein BKI52_33100 [marine bacterium AO1-C]
MRSITVTIHNPNPTRKILTFFGSTLGIPAIQELSIIYRREEDLRTLPDAEQIYIYGDGENGNAPVILRRDEVDSIVFDANFQQLEYEVLTNPIRVLGIKIRSNNQEDQYFNSELTYVQKSVGSQSENRVVIQNGFNPNHNNPVLELSDPTNFDELIFDGSAYLQLRFLEPHTSLTVEFQYITQQDVIDQIETNNPKVPDLNPKEIKNIPPEKFLRKWWNWKWNGHGKRPWWSYIIHPPWFPISLIVLITIIVIIAKYEDESNAPNAP